MPIANQWLHTLSLMILRSFLLLHICFSTFLGIPPVFCSWNRCMSGGNWLLMSSLLSQCQMLSRTAFSTIKFHDWLVSSQVEFEWVGGGWGGEEGGGGYAVTLPVHYQKELSSRIVLLVWLDIELIVSTEWIVQFIHSFLTASPPQMISSSLLPSSFHSINS